MGCDGGTIPRRDELVKVKKKPEQKDKNSELSFQWQHCTISQEPLEQPIVMCGMGRLYSKTAVIEALLDRSRLPECSKHIKNLKDIKNLNLTPNPEFKSDQQKTEGALDNRGVPYICPVTGLEMSGKFRFVALWSCGCAFAERAFKEIKTKTCLICLKPYCEEDVVVLNGTDEDMAVLKVYLQARQAKQKTKKIKSEPKEVEETVVSENGSSESEPLNVDGKVKKEPNVDSQNASSNGVSAKRSAVIVPQAQQPKKTKTTSIAHDPNASDVYKSLFTSHKSEKEQNRAHWVTYNPFYN